VVQTGEAFSAAIAAAVAEAERHTSAEIVVVVAPRAASWAGVAAAAGAAVAWLVLALAVFAHFVEVHPVALLVELPLAGLGAAWLVHRSPGLLRRLVPAGAQAAAVTAAAQAAFVAEQVHETRARTGVLLFLSVLEQRTALVVDAGVEGAVPDGALAALRFGPGPGRLGSLDELCAGIRAAGLALGRHLPPVPGDNPDELSNAPRVRA
jgi:putative membrane protein